MLKKYLSLFVVTSLFIGLFSMSAQAIPVGCRGGVSGSPVPGTICPDGSIPVKDPTLPIGCPGSSQQGPVPESYTVTCPIRPGRAECTYTEATGACQAAAGNVDEDGQKIYDRLLQAINVISGLVGIIVVISIIIGGIQYTTAGGDPQKVAAAKTRVFTSIFALVAYLFLYAFLQYLVPGGVF